MREPVAKTLTAMLTEGQLIDDKYRLLGEIAQGDLGPVYQVAEVPSGHICVLRLITRVASPDGSLVGRLRQESEQVEKLRHPNIMPFGEVGEVEGQVYAAREFVEGVTLQDLIEREAPFSLPRACSIARQVASALETAHNAGVLHGNLNPSNVLVNEQDGLAAVKVLGLGSFALRE
ncbi:MAG: serine/threonine protein kinase, partial [Terriglobia bacterium]